MTSQDDPCSSSGQAALQFTYRNGSSNPLVAFTQLMDQVAGAAARHLGQCALEQAESLGLTRHEAVGRLVSDWKAALSTAPAPRRTASWLQPKWQPVLASLSAAPSLGQRHAPSDPSPPSLQLARLTTATPLYDVAMAKDEVKARLAPIPVFTVANPKNEFVLVAGENNTQLGFFFFRREDAEAIVEKIREENPRLARDSKILRVTMDNVYEVFTTPREQTGLQGIHFRFMPDMRQVVHALNLYREAGVPTRSFTGVPVFQAEGLTVTAQDMQYVPLFLTKEDLDVAVQSAYKQRNQAQIQVYRDKAAKYEEDYNQVAVQAQSATGREKTALEARAQKAKSKLDAAKEKAEAVEKAPMPKVEVGSFEEVMQRMTDSNGSELAAWSQVMFVAPGLLHSSLSGPSK